MKERLSALYFNWEACNMHSTAFLIFGVGKLLEWAGGARFMEQGGRKPGRTTCNTIPYWELGWGFPAVFCRSQYCSPVFGG